MFGSARYTVFLASGLFCHGTMLAGGGARSFYVLRTKRCIRVLRCWLGGQRLGRYWKVSKAAKGEMGLASPANAQVFSVPVTASAQCSERQDPYKHRTWFDSLAKQLAANACVHIC